MIDAILRSDRTCRHEPESASDGTILGARPTLVTVWRRDLVCDHANGASRDWFGLSPDEIVGSRLRDLLGDRLFEISHPFIEGALAGREQRFEGAFAGPDEPCGQAGPCGQAVASYIPRFDGAGDVLGFVMQVVDGTPAAEARRVLSVASLVYDCMREGVIVADLDGMIVSVNPAFTALTGYAAADVTGRTSRSLGFDGASDAAREAIRREISATGVWRGDLWSRRRNGEAFLVEQTMTLAHGPDGRVMHTVALFHDVTESRRDLHRLNQQARRDALTGLANRSVLLERLDGLTRNTDREPPRFAVLFVDLDGFKTVNDRLGHDAGDLVLRMVAMRLTASVREGDLVARLAGDEFVVVVESRDVASGAAEIASRIRRAIRRPIPFGDATISVQASVGQAMFPDDGTTPPGLIACADTRMYAVKSDRRR